MKNQSVLSLWQRWNHVSSLIEKRASTMREIRKLSPKEVDSELKMEFGDEYPAHWKDMIAKPLAEDMCRLGGFDKVSVEGPFGISSRLRMSFFAKDQDKPVADINIEPVLDVASIEKGKSILCKRDYTTHNERYLPGSVGEMNGLNFGVIEIDNDAKGYNILHLLDYI